MARDQRTKRYAEQIEQDSAEDYMPIVSGGVTNNFLSLNASGQGQDSGYNAGSFSVLANEAFAFFVGRR
jgi:hypothetical protein